MYSSDDDGKMSNVFASEDTTHQDDDDIDLSGEDDDTSADEVTDTENESDSEMDPVEQEDGEIESSPEASVGSNLSEDEDDLFTDITVIDESSSNGVPAKAAAEKAHSLFAAAKDAVREVKRIQPKVSPFLGNISQNASSGAKKKRAPATGVPSKKANPKKRKAEDSSVSAFKRPKHAPPKKTILLENHKSSVVATSVPSPIPSFPDLPESKLKSKSKPKSKTLAQPSFATRKTVEAGDLVQCMTAGSLSGKASGRNQKMVVTGGNTVNSILDPEKFSESSGGKIERPNDGDVRNMYQKLGKTFSDTVQVSHILPELDTHTPENSHNRGAVLNGFLVPRRVKSKSDSMKNVDWHFFPLNPTNELNLYRMEYVDTTNRNEQGQIQAKYKEIYNCGNIRQSDGPLTVEFPKNTGKQWSFDHRWFSTAGFETIKVQSQRPASKKKAVSEPESSQAAVDPRAKNKKAIQGNNESSSAPPVPVPAPAPAPVPTPAPACAPAGMELLLANQKRILANQERIMNMEFLSEITVKMPSMTGH